MSSGKEVEREEQEGEGGGGKEDEGVDEHSRARRHLLTDFAEFCESGGFQRRLTDWRRKHCAAFAADAASREVRETMEGEAMHADEREHSLEFSSLQQEYLAVIEEEMTKFLEQEGKSAGVEITPRDLFEELQDALADKYCALFEESEHHWLGDAVVSMLQYETFYQEMVKEHRDMQSLDSDMLDLLPDDDRGRK